MIARFNLVTFATSAAASIGHEIYGNYSISRAKRLHEERLKKLQEAELERSRLQAEMEKIQADKTSIVRSSLWDTVSLTPTDRKLGRDIKGDD